MAARYDVTNLGAAQRSATKTVLLITAGALPVTIPASSVEATDNPTSYQLDCAWQKVTSFSPTPAGQGTTSVTPVNEDAAYPAAGFTVIGDINAEPTYDAAYVREAHSGPSVIGYHSHQGAVTQEVRIEAGDSWGLVILTASFGLTTFRATALAEEGW